MVAMEAKRTEARQYHPSDLDAAIGAGYKALALAVFDQAVKDAGAKDPLTRSDAIAWLAFYGREWLGDWGLGIRPSLYAAMLAELEAVHAQKTIDEEREKELAAFWKVFPRAINLYTRQAAACLLS